MVTIAPSILSSDFTRLGEECEAVLEAGADWLHVDVMDGHFVPNITIGIPVVERLRDRFPDQVLDVHIMVEDPDTWGPAFAEAGADIVSFHPEATDHAHRVAESIRSAGGRPSLAINPGTPLDWVEYLADSIEMVLVMSVNPGFSGQDFIGATYRKLRDLRGRLDRLGWPDMSVQVDGGVGPSNADDVRRAGADVMVAGSAIFGAESYGDAIEGMRAAARSVEAELV